MVKFSLTYKLFGTKAILIEWPQQVDTNILNDLVGFKKIILRELNNVEIVPAYNSLTLIFNNEINFEELRLFLINLYEIGKKNTHSTKKVWHIPVCYSDVYGLDIINFLKNKKLSLKELIKLHTDTFYTVYCIGFLPGFMYLGGLNNILHEPRRKEPRLKIPKGSVGIGGNQTGIYPQTSPGGWNIIGNSPVKLFDRENDNPCKISIGDKIKFYDVSEAEHGLLSIQVKTGIYKMESEVIND